MGLGSDGDGSLVSLGATVLSGAVGSVLGSTGDGSVVSEDPSSSGAGSLGAGSVGESLDVAGDGPGDVLSTGVVVSS